MYFGGDPSHSVQCRPNMYLDVILLEEFRSAKFMGLSIDSGNYCIMQSRPGALIMVPQSTFGLVIQIYTYAGWLESVLSYFPSQFSSY